MIVIFSNQTVVLREALGRGAAGTVYRHPSRRDQCIKIYNDETLCEEMRINWLCLNPPLPLWERGWPTFACPIEPVYSALSGNMCGFSMPLVQDAVSFKAIINPSSRVCEVRRPWLWRVAISFLTRLQALHFTDFITGDFNLDNFCVGRRGQVAQLDIDSVQFQIPGGAIFPTRMHRPELAPPELVYARLPVLDRTQDQDAFSAFIVVHRLLREGVHPFDAWHLGNGDPPRLTEMIRDGIWPDSMRHPQFRPKPGPVPFQAFPKALQELFVRMFQDGHRDRSARPTVSDLLSCLMQHAPGQVLARRSVSRYSWNQQFEKATSEKRRPLEMWRSMNQRHKRWAVAGGSLLGIGALVPCFNSFQTAEAATERSLVPMTLQDAPLEAPRAIAAQLPAIPPVQKFSAPRPAPRLWREAAFTSDVH